jgi:hypothetical protein
MSAYLMIFERRIKMKDGGTLEGIENFMNWCFGIYLKTHSRCCVKATPTIDMHVSFG